MAQAAGFRPDACVCLEDENAFETGPTRVISANTDLRLRFLDEPTVAAALGEFVTPAEIAALLARKDQILQYFDALVKRKGYAAVVVE